MRLARDRRADAARDGDRHWQDQARHRDALSTCSPPSVSVAFASSWIAARSGKQADGEFSTTKVVSVKTFAEIFGLKGLERRDPGNGNQGPHLHHSGARQARPVRRRHVRDAAGRSI